MDRLEHVRMEMRIKLDSRIGITTTLPYAQACVRESQYCMKKSLSGRAKGDLKCRNAEGMAQVENI
jgi:hypothetical protein